MSTVIGIDPAASTGLFAFKPETKEIQMIELIKPPAKLDYDRKIKFIADSVADAFSEFTAEELVMVAIESFHITHNLNVNNKMQALRGGIISRIPASAQIQHVPNTLMKKWVGGKGSDDKEAVADGLQRYFSPNKKSADEIDQIIRKEQWDLTDAGGIAVTGWEMRS